MNKDPLSVFLVDDEPKVLRGLRLLIPWEEAGYRIIGQAINGLEALHRIRAEQCDLLITDIKMPLMDGLELARQVKTLYPGIFVLMLTGYEEFKLVKQSLIIGAADYLLKPVGPEELLASLRRVREALEQRRFPYPYKLEAELIASLREVDLPGIKAIVQKLYNLALAQKIPSEMYAQILKRLLMSIGQQLDPAGAFKEQHPFLAREIAPLHQLQQDFSQAVLALVGQLSARGSRGLINQVKVYLQQNLDRKLSQAEVAAQFLIHPSYLSQLFRKIENMTYTQYVQRIRMSRAGQLLKNSRFRIGEIAEMVSFKDERYFAKCFKHYSGQTPSQYRKS